MAILRELWSGEVNDEQVLSTYQYVIELRERLEQTCQLARDNLNQRTSGPVNAHLISWPSKAQDMQNLENIW